jgi:hypothetical protein
LDCVAHQIGQHLPHSCRVLKPVRIAFLSDYERLLLVYASQFVRDFVT